MKSLLNLKIRTHLLMLVATLMMVPLGIIIFTSLKQLDQDEIETKNKISQFAGVVSKELSSFTASTELLLSTITKLSIVQQHNVPAVNNLFAGIIKQHPIYSNFLLLDKTGKLLASSLPAKNAISYAERRYFKNAIASGKFSSSETVIGKLIGKPTFAFAQPIKADSGEITGVAVAVLSIENYKDMFVDVKYMEGASVLLVDHKGTILFNSLYPELIGKQDKPELFKRMTEGPEEGTFEAVGNIGRYRIMSYRKLKLPHENTPYMYVRAAIDHKKAMSQAYKNMQVNLTILVSFILVMFGSAVFFSKKYVVDKIEALQSAAADLAQGKLTIKVADQVVGGDLGDLARTFDTMAQGIALREQELSISQKNYQEIFDATKEAIFVHDAKTGEILKTNKAVEDMFGYAKDELKSLTLNDLSLGESPFSMNEAVQLIEKTLSEGSQTFEWLSKRKNGECFYTEVVLTMSHYSGESRVLAVVRDISERKKSESDLARQAMLLELTKDSIFVRDMADTVTYWNRGAEINYGWTSKEAKGQVTHLLLKTAFPIPLNEILDCLYRTDYWEGELKHTRKDGSQIFVASRWTLMRDDKGAPNAVFEINSDITARKQSEIEITRLTAMLDESQHIAKVGGWEIDLITNTLYWSDETYRIHDTSPAEYTPTLETAIAFYDPESLPIINAAVKAAIEDDKEFNLEMKLITAKGRPILVHTTCKVIRENGTPIKIIGAFRDITEQRRTEEKLRQSLKMESIGRLAGGVAHDFNNKLTVILGYSELLKLEYPDNHDLLKKLNEICNAAQHSRDITAQLLTFSRQQIISPKPICLNTTIKEMQRTLPRLIGEDLSLSFALAENLGNVLIDPVQFDQIVMNLAVNARDAMPDGGDLVISTANTKIDEEFCQKHPDATPGDYVQLTISDNGHGMDSETLKHIFEPFYTTKEVGKGTGLGLATIYGIVTQNNGFITVDSELNRGTLFKVYFPQLAERVEKEVEKTSNITLGTGAVLLVEDDDTVRKLTATMLKNMGYTVQQISTPDEAIRFCEDAENRIDVVLSDVIMPQMNGKDMMDKIEQIRPGIKSLFMSGYSASHISDKGVVEGKVNFVPKPFNIIQLSEKIEEVLKS